MRGAPLCGAAGLTLSGRVGWRLFWQTTASSRPACPRAMPTRHDAASWCSRIEVGEHESGRVSVRDDHLWNERRRRPARVADSAACGEAWPAATLGLTTSRPVATRRSRRRRRRCSRTIRRSRNDHQPRKPRTPFNIGAAARGARAPTSFARPSRTRNCCGYPNHPRFARVRAGCTPGKGNAFLDARITPRPSCRCCVVPDGACVFGPTAVERDSRSEALRSVTACRDTTGAAVMRSRIHIALFHRTYNTRWHRCCPTVAHEVHRDARRISARE
jgi:hypothetical protein